MNDEILNQTIILKRGLPTVRAKRVVKNWYLLVQGQKTWLLLFPCIQWCRRFRHDCNRIASSTSKKNHIIS